MGSSFLKRFCLDLFLNSKPSVVRWYTEHLGVLSRGTNWRTLHGARCVYVQKDGSCQAIAQTSGRKRWLLCAGKSCSIVQTHNPDLLRNENRAKLKRTRYLAIRWNYHLVLMDDFSQSRLSVFLIICGFKIYFSCSLCNPDGCCRVWVVSVCKVSSWPLSFGVISRLVEALCYLPSWKADKDDCHACWQVKTHHGCHRKLLSWVMSGPRFPEVTPAAT